MPENRAMTFDEISLDRSNTFLKALQELKSLRPQIYSAADYCEKSYLHTEHKQMVLENLKDYAVRALINAVDHLGTVASKLNDLFEKQDLDVSTVELKISSLNQQIFTCQSYMDKEGLRQQQVLAIIPRFHKRSIFPNSVNWAIQNCPRRRIDIRQKHVQARLQPHPSALPSPRTLSWHLASENTSPLNGVPHGYSGSEKCQASVTTQLFSPLGAEEVTSSSPALAYRQSSSRSPASSAVLNTFDVTQKDSAESTKRLSPLRSVDIANRRGVSRTPVRRKSLLSAFFVKPKVRK